MTRQSDSAGLFDVPNTESRSFVPAGRVPMGAVALGLAAVLALGAGKAAAQGTGVCSNPVPVLPEGTTEEQVRELSGILRQGAIAESPHVAIYCRYGRADRNNRGILVHNPQIVVVDDFVPGIEGFHEGIGDLSIFVHSVSGEPGSAGDFIHPSPVDYGQGIFTTGNAEDFITGEDSYGIHARHTGEGRAGIDVRNVSVRTTGDYSHGVYVWQQGSYRLGEDGSAYRAPGAVIVNLIETDRDRDQRVRPVVRTNGDYADAVRAEYTRAAARGHIAVTVEGYTLTTGGIVPEQALVSGVDSEEVIEVSAPDRPGHLPAFDPSRPWIANPDYDPSDPNSPEFLNVFASVRGDGSIARDDNGLPKIDLRPYSVVYLPRRNPYYDPDDPDSPEPEFIASPQTSDIAIWNGRYFLALSGLQDEDVAACQGESTAEARRACYEEALDAVRADSIAACQSESTAEARRACYVNTIAEMSGDNVPTGFEARGIYASHEGHGDIRIRATDNDIRTRGVYAHGIYATHTGRTRTETSCTADDPADCVGPDAPEGETVVTPGGGGVSIVVTGGAIDTRGEDSHGVWARHRGDSGADEADGTVDPDDVGTGNVAIAVTDADIDTAGDHARGVYGLIQQTCTADTAEGCKEAENLVAGTGVGDIDIAVTGGSITTAGVGGAYAVHARHENTGAITVRLTGVDVDTEGNQAHGVFADHVGSEGDVSVTVDGGSVATQGDDAHGVYGAHAGSGDVTVAVVNGAAVTTNGIGAQGVRADHDGDGGLTVEAAGSVTTEGAGAHGVHGAHAGSGDVKVTLASGGAVTTKGFGAQGVRAGLAGDGDLTVEVAGDVTTEGEGSEQEGGVAHGVYGTHAGSGDLAIGMTAGVVTAKGIEAHGLYASHTGAAGAVTVTVSGGSVTAEGAGSAGVLAHHGASDREGAVTVTVGQGASVTGGLVGIQLIADADSDGNVPTSTVNVDGTVRGVSSAGIYLPTGGTVNVRATGTVSGGSAGIFSDGDYDTDVTVAGAVTGDVLNEGDGDLTFTSQADGTVTGNVHGRGAGALTADVAGMVTGDILNEGGGALTFTSRAGSTVTGTVHNPRSPLTVHGKVGRLLYDNGGTVTVAGTGRLTGIEVEGRKEAIRSEAGDLTATISGAVTGDILNRGSGDLTADVAGTVTGDILNEGDGALTFTSRAGSTVTGTVHNPRSPLTVHGKVGRLLYDNGGTVTVAGTGRLTGIEVEGRKEAIRSEAGDLAVTVDRNGEVQGDVRAKGDGDLMATISGAVTGDVLGEGSGDHTVTVMNGGTVGGTIRLAASTVTVDGTAGRVWLDNGGTVTVGEETGLLTGVEVERDGVMVREAVRSDTGNLTATLAGTIMGDVLVRGTGVRQVTVAGGGKVEGNIRAEGDGDLTATISGAVTGDVFGEGTGDHTVTVMNGGTVSGIIRLAASTVTVDGMAGRVWLENGGTVTVGSTGRITGVEGDDGTEVVRSDTGNLTATLAGAIMGDVLVRGTGVRRINVAGGGEVEGNIRAEGGGDLTATISGAVTGDILALGTGVHRVTVATGGDVAGTVRVATRTGRDETDSALTVNGAVGRVHLDRGGALTVGPKGRIRGIGGIAISADKGNVVDLDIQESPGETAEETLGRVKGRFAVDRVTLRLLPADGSEPERLGPLGTAAAAPRGPYDLGLDENGVLMREVAPRARLYEALPAVMLGLNSLSEFRDRMAAPRDASGRWARMSVADAGGSASAGGGPQDARGGWARVHGSRGEWKADNTWTGVETSTAVESRWSGFQAGLDAPVGEDGLFGISLHHRKGSVTVSNASAMDVSGGAGYMDLSGTGGGISGTWRRDGVYVDLQAGATWYEADLNSSTRGMLMEDVSGYGYALGVEAGRRVASGTDGVVFIPRAGLVHSKVSLTDFTDLAGGSRVSLEDGRSLKGRMGVSVDVETKLSGNSESSFLYSLDVEHEFEDETKVSMTRGKRWDLASTAEATWVRAGVDVSHAWDDGRYTIQGGVSYAVGGSDSNEYGGGLKLKVRF